MIRQLKAMLTATVALVALAAIGAPGAQAAEEGKFHCSVANCTVTLKPDGSSGKEKHHVGVVSNGTTSASLTCNEMSGTATSTTKTTKELTFTGIKYTTCIVAGAAAEVKMNSCDYLFTDSGEVHLKCSTAGDALEVIAGSCQIKFAPQTVSAVAYTSINSKKEVTVSINITNMVATTSGCAGLGLPDGTYSKSAYSTGNTIVQSISNSVWYE